MGFSGGVSWEKRVLGWNPRKGELQLAELVLSREAVLLPMLLVLES